MAADRQAQLSTRDGLRWAALFDDLAAQADALEQAERAVELQDRTRSEVAGLSLLDRLGSALGVPLRLRTSDGRTVSGRPVRLGPDWVLLEHDGGRELLVRLGAVTAVSGLGRRSQVPGSTDPVTARLGLWFLLRRMARDRSGVVVGLADGSTLSATIDRVGRDFIEVAAHPPGEARRRNAVREVLLVPMHGLIAVGREAAAG